MSISGNGPLTASRGPLEFFQLANAHRIEGVLHGRKLPAHYRRHDRSDRELSMAMAAGAMLEGTSPLSSLRSPAPSLCSPGPHLRSSGPHLRSPSPPLRSSVLAASIPSGEVSGVAAARGGSEGSCHGGLESLSRSRKLRFAGDGGPRSDPRRGVPTARHVLHRRQVSREEGMCVHYFHL
jgi:hypothetical protein